MINLKKTEMGVVIVRLFGLIIKIPLSFGGFNEFRLEQKKLKLVAEDLHFSNFLPIIKNYYYFSVMPYYETFGREKHKNIIAGYFIRSFADCENWPKIKLRYLIEAEIFSSFVKKYLNDYSYWENILENIYISSSSSHGDFHYGNMLISNNQLLFIDWSNYKKDSSRYFDIIDYYVVAGNNKSWFDNFKELFFSNKRSLDGISINNKYLFCYCLWKIAKELRELENFNKLSQAKIKKYQNFLIAMKAMANNYDKEIK